MSHTQSVGVFGYDHWALAARSAVEALESIIQSKLIGEGDFPQSLHVDLADFFGYLGEALNVKIPKNPPASARAHQLASHIIVAWGVTDRPAIENLLKSYCQFFSQLLTPRILDESEWHIAVSFGAFMNVMRERGERVAGNSPPSRIQQRRV